MTESIGREQTFPASVRDRRTYLIWHVTYWVLFGPQAVGLAYAAVAGAGSPVLWLAPTLVAAALLVGSVASIRRVRNVGVTIVDVGDVRTLMVRNAWFDHRVPLSDVIGLGTYGRGRFFPDPALAVLVLDRGWVITSVLPEADLMFVLSRPIGGLRSRNVRHMPYGVAHARHLIGVITKVRVRRTDVRV